MRRTSAPLAHDADERFLRLLPERTHAPRIVDEVDDVILAEDAEQVPAIIACVSMAGCLGCAVPFAHS